MLPIDETTIVPHVNTGEFWDKHPGVWPGVTRYIDTDDKGNILDVWERDKNGVMVDVTERERLRVELAAAQADLERYTEDED